MKVRLPSPTFMPGRYRLKLFLGIPFMQHVDDIDNALSFEILPPEMPWRPYELHPSRGVTCIKADWKCETDRSPRTDDETIPTRDGSADSVATKKR